MKIKSTLIFLHATIENISRLVLGLSLLSLLPRPVIVILTLNQLLSPALITILTISYSAYLAHRPQPTTKLFDSPERQLIKKTPNALERNILSYFYFGVGKVKQLFKKISNALESNILPDLYFGLCKGLQSLTVISYIRSSLHLPKTILTPSISSFIATLCATLSFYCKENSPSHSFHISKNAIDFFLNTVTSFGFLYLLNTTRALPAIPLSALFLCLISLSIFVENENSKKPGGGDCVTQEGTADTSLSVVPSAPVADSVNNLNAPHDRSVQKGQSPSFTWAPVTDGRLISPQRH